METKDVEGTAGRLVSSEHLLPRLKSCVLRARAASRLAMDKVVAAVSALHRRGQRSLFRLRRFRHAADLRCSPNPWSRPLRQNSNTAMSVDGLSRLQLLRPQSSRNRRQSNTVVEMTDPRRLQLLRPQSSHNRWQSNTVIEMKDPRR